MYLDEEVIVSFESPHKLRELCIPEEDSDGTEEYQVNEQQFHIRMANSKGQREAASLLIKKKYAWRGYSFEPSLDSEPSKITLVTETDGKTVGTMTLCLDLDNKLPADENFRDKLDQLRAGNRRLCEASRLAIEKDLPYRVFAAMIHISYMYAHNIHGFTDYVIEVNPRHAMFYKRMLGFKDLGVERICTRVNAPAVLLRLEFDYMKEQIKKFGGLFENHGSVRSFYPYFFSKHDEPGITNRLRTGKT